MWYRQLTWSVCASALLALGVIAVAPAHAQSVSGIAGVVRDSSGGVLPGATVEVASPALIEGTRSTISGANGTFQITDLRPGDYVVTFSLPGFRTVRREGIRLGASFTATVNVELSVGQLEETVTVSGASPLVDVRNSVSQSVMTPRDARHDSHRQGPLRGGPADRRRHHRHARTLAARRSCSSPRCRCTARRTTTTCS